MNNRNSVNESNLVNISADLPTVNQLETKDSLLSFPFDHIYACHSESGDGRPAPPADKEVVVSTHCVTAEPELSSSSSPDVTQLASQLTTAENQNKRLKELLIYHLDLIQQQNDAISKKEKLFQSLKLENDTLKSRLNRMDRRVTLNQRHSSTHPPPLVDVVGVSQPATKPATATSQIMLDSLTELLIPEPADAYLFTKSFPQDTFDLLKQSCEADTQSYIPKKVAVSSTVTNNKGLNQTSKMIERRATYIKKDIKTEPYPTGENSTDTSNHKMQRRGRRITNSLKAPKTLINSEASDTPLYQEKPYERLSVNKKSKMINTYTSKYSQNNGNQKKPIRFHAGSLSERLQLIDTTPTGEDPYQLGEADMREQSPIPKLMLQKNKCRTNSNATSHFYDSTLVESNPDTGINKIKLNRYNLTNTYMHSSEIKKEDPDSPQGEVDYLEGLEGLDMDLVKTEAEIDWRLYESGSQEPATSSAPVTSLRDFSYGENSSNWSSLNYNELFESPRFPEVVKSETLASSTVGMKSAADKSTRRVGRTTSLMMTSSIKNNAKTPVKGGRKRAMSTTSLLKSLKRQAAKTMGAPSRPAGGAKAVAAALGAPVTAPGAKAKFFGTTLPAPIPGASPPAAPAPAAANAAANAAAAAANAAAAAATPKPKIVKGKAPLRRSPVPGMRTKRPYHTQMGHADLTWYLGLDTDLKLEDLGLPTEEHTSSVEVPNWREIVYAGCDEEPLAEDMDDRAFERRHLKLELEERRQLRWHMRRVREQRHVARLRQRQRDPWGSAAPPSAYTVWPRPHADLQYVEITDKLPVAAFGEEVPALPAKIFVLPWVRHSKPLKKIKRSKTLI